MTGLPPVEPLAFGGMAVVAFFALWKLQVQPRLARRRDPHASGG